MDSETRAIINKMHAAVVAMSIVVEEVTSLNCHGRKAMNARLGELDDAINELNKPPVEITSEMVRRLREQSGDGLMMCRKALVKTNGNYELAVLYLRYAGNIK